MRMACLRLAGGLSGNEYNLGVIIIHGEFNRNMTSMRTFMKTLGLIRSKNIKFRCCQRSRDNQG